MNDLIATKSFVDASRNGGVNRGNLIRLETNASASKKRCIPAQSDFVEGHWHAVPFKGNHHCLKYMLVTPNQVPAGTTMTIHARATRGKTLVFSDARVDVRENLKPTMLLDTAGAHVNDFKIQISATSKMYIGVELASPDSTCEIKYTFDECAPIRTHIAAGHWLTAPFQQQHHCFYIFETPEEVEKGTIVTIRARATKGKVTLSTGTSSNVRQIFRHKMALDTARANEDHFQFTTSVSSKVYIGVKLDSPDATCEVKYTTTKTQTTQKLIVRARVNAADEARHDNGVDSWMYMVVGSATVLVVACAAFILIACARKRKTKRPEQRDNVAAAPAVTIQMQANQINNGTNERDHFTVSNQGDLAYHQKHGGGHAPATTATLSSSLSAATISSSLSAAATISSSLSAAATISPTAVLSSPAVSASAAVSLSLVSSATISSPAVPTATVVPPATCSHHGNEPVMVEAEVVGWVRADSTEESKTAIAQLDNGVWETDVMTSRVGHPPR